MSKNDKEENSRKGISRRELLAKYGAYTAPTVVSLLIPSQSYGHVNSNVYSTSLDCAADITGGTMHAPPPIGLMGHCMLNGSGGSQTHTIINPTVP